MDIITIDNNNSAEYVEKKSRFIADIIKVDSIEEAKIVLNNIKKKYHDAKHHCFAYRVLDENSICERQSDDGEPSGTAGMPLLNILQKKEIVNCIIVVTRYFGGILLGTGGLTHAYNEAGILALEKCNLKKYSYGYEIEVIVKYEGNEEFKYLCNKNNFKIVNTEYTDNVKYILELTENQYELFRNIKETGDSLSKIESFKEKSRKYVEND